MTDAALAAALAAQYCSKKRTPRCYFYYCVREANNLISLASPPFGLRAFYAHMRTHHGWLYCTGRSFDCIKFTSEGKSREVNKYNAQHEYYTDSKKWYSQNPCRKRKPVIITFHAAYISMDISSLTCISQCVLTFGKVQSPLSLIPYL